MGPSRLAGPSLSGAVPPGPPQRAHRLGVPGHPQPPGRWGPECTPGPGGSTCVSSIGDLLLETEASLRIREGLLCPWAVTVNSCLLIEDFPPSACGVLNGSVVAH